MIARRLTTATAALALTTGLLAVGAPAHARPQSITVSLRFSETVAVNGTGITVSGKVSGRSAKAVVVLQRKKAGTWVSLRSTKVKASKRYSMRTTVRPGVTRYRIKVKANPRIRGAVTGVVKVRGVKAPSNPPPASKPSPGLASPAPAVASAQVRRILEETNAFRARHGLRALVLEPRMSKVAADWSRTMAQRDIFEHNPDYSSQIPSGWRLSAENIAAGYSQATVVQGWIDSPGHRRNLLGDFTHIGIGHEIVPGSEYNSYSTQVFAKYP